MSSESQARAYLPGGGDARVGPRFGWLADPRLPTVLFAVAAAASAVLLLVLGSRLTFFIDDWDLLTQRVGLSADALFAPHAEHIVLAPALIYKAIQATAGMESPTPYQVVSVALFILTVALAFIYMRRRVGGWLAFAACLPLLFFGAAYEDLLSAFQMGYFGSMACGLAMLLALERRDRLGDGLACALLVVSLSFSSVGLPFLAGAALATALDARRLGSASALRRAYLVVAPALLYGLWWLGWGHEAENQLSFNNIATSPSYVLDGFAASVSSLLGLATPRNEAQIGALDWGRPLLAGLGVIAGLRLLVLGRVPRWLWVVAAIGACFWALSAFNASEFRSPTASRYMFVGGVFVLLIAAELARGARVGRAALAITLLVVAAAVASNLEFLRQTSSGFAVQAKVVRGGLAGLEIARDSAPPDLLLNADNSNFDYFAQLRAGSYLAAVADHGSPAYTPAELASAPEPARAAADKVLATALGLDFRRGHGAAAGDCTDVAPKPDGSSVTRLAPGGAVVEVPRGEGIEASLRRYATQSFPVDAGVLPGGGAQVLEIPADRSDEPWELQLSGRARVCALAGA